MDPKKVSPQVVQNAHQSRRVYVNSREGFLFWNSNDITEKFQYLILILHKMLVVNLYLKSLKGSIHEFRR